MWGIAGMAHLLQMLDNFCGRDSIALHTGMCPKYGQLRMCELLLVAGVEAAMQELQSGDVKTSSSVGR